VKSSKNEKTLASWRTLNEAIARLTEADLARLLRLERANKRRPMVIKRLHQRLNKLRVAREREELRKDP
jgi:arsenate reductase-like glutaredoxin family protein